MSYSKEGIIKLTEFVKGNKDAGKWLVDNNLKELELLYYALKGYDGALKELSNKKYFVPAAFVNAIRGNATAFNWLVKNKQYEWVAMAEVLNKKGNAALWLKKNNLDHYFHLAIAFQNELIIENEGDILGIMTKFFKMLLRGPFK